MKGKYFVILFIVTFVGLVVATTVGRSILDDDFGLNQAGAGLNKVHKAAWVWAEANGDVYPDHVALLQANNYFRAQLFNDPRQPGGTVWEVNGVDARPFMNEIIRHRNQERLDRTPLIEAVENDPTRDEPYYRYGDYYFVRLDKPRTHEYYVARLSKPRTRSDLIFGWTLPEEDGRRFVVFDDDAPMRASASQWKELWKQDAKAREELGLRQFEPPD